MRLDKKINEWILKIKDFEDFLGNYYPKNPNACAIKRSKTPHIPPNPATRTVNKFIGIWTNGSKSIKKREIHPSITWNSILNNSPASLNRIPSPRSARINIIIPSTMSSKDILSRHHIVWRA